MSQTTRREILETMRRRYLRAGPKHKRKLLDQAQELLGWVVWVWVWVGSQWVGLGRVWVGSQGRVAQIVR
jgi:hypothetical protein